MASRGVSSIPTLAVETDFPAFVTDATVLDSPLARALTSEQIIDRLLEETDVHDTRSLKDAAAPGVL